MAAAESVPEIDLDNVIDRLLEGAHFSKFSQQL